MTSSLTEMRQKWRPRLAWGTTYNCIAYPWASLLIVLLKPETGPHVVALALALFGLGASLFGIRQIGKNAGVED